jgi:hypothetical protein
MGDESHFSVLCRICQKAVKLESKILADPKGQAVHEKCLAKEILAKAQAEDH